MDFGYRDPNEHGGTEIGRLSNYNQWGTMEMNEFATGGYGCLCESIDSYNWTVIDSPTDYITSWFETMWFVSL